MNWIIENWMVAIAGIAFVVAAVLVVYRYFGLPTKVQIAKIKEWMLWAVMEAEINLGSGTGPLKLRFVYDMFISRFPLVAKVVSFETFKGWVELALVEMKDLLDTNEAVEALITPPSGE